MASSQYIFSSHKEIKMRQPIKTDAAPAAIGPYSQAVKNKSGAILFCSGQIPLDPATNEIIGENAADQCRQVMKNLSAVLEAAGADWGHVAKTTIYLSNLGDFSAVNKIYGEYFKADPPARATVEVSRLPMDVKVEIDAIAII